MSAIAHHPMLSSMEQQKAAGQLAATRKGLHNAVRGLNREQLEFKPAQDTWCIAEILEHLVLIERRAHVVIERMPGAPAPEEGQGAKDEFIRERVPDRSQKITAPPPVQPCGQWCTTEALKLFDEGRNRTLDLLTNAPCLRGHVLPHPIFGAWDGYQWIIAVAAHTDRHTRQIAEVKANAGFPKG